MLLTPFQQSNLCIHVGIVLFILNLNEWSFFFVWIQSYGLLAGSNENSDGYPLPFVNLCVTVEFGALGLSL